jgi:hypothetical protein
MREPKKTMTLLLTTLPDERTELAKTLERYLISPELDHLVGELTSLHGETPSSVKLRKFLDDDLGNVLVLGLTSLPGKKLRQLLRYPALLIELHDLVLMEGGPYWDQLLEQEPSIQGVVQSAGARLQASLGLQKPPFAAPIRERRPRFFARPIFVSLTTAAAVLAAVYFGNQYRENQRAWGWNRPGLLTKATGPKDHFRILAEAGDEFTRHAQNSPEALDQDLREMKDGCLRLQAAKHPQLSERDRDWLKKECKGWGQELDQHLIDLRSGAKDWRIVRQEANGSVEKLVKALRDREIHPGNHV